MIVSEHLCGLAIAYNDRGSTHKRKKVDQVPGRYQGSLVNYQKRQVANAVEWLRIHSVHAPRILTFTTSPKWGSRIYEPQISTLIHTLSNGYGLNNYVWVREFNGSGSPHYHMIADMPKIKFPKGLSLYWSGLFGASANNSMRMGSAPVEGRRRYVIDSPKMAFYFGKYMGKEMNNKIFQKSWHSAKMPGKKFGISHECSSHSQPDKFEAQYYYQEYESKILDATGNLVQRPSVCIGTAMKNEVGNEFNKSLYKWKKIEGHNVWFGKKLYQK